jgi:hypothetical protein
MKSLFSQQLGGNAMRWKKRKKIKIININKKVVKKGYIHVGGWVSSCGVFAVHKHINQDYMDDVDKEYQLTHLATGARIPGVFKCNVVAKRYTEVLAAEFDFSKISDSNISTKDYYKPALINEELAAQLSALAKDVRSRLPHI